MSTHNNAVPCPTCGAKGVCLHKYSHVRWQVGGGVPGPLLQHDDDFDIEEKTRRALQEWYEGTKVPAVAANNESNVHNPPPSVPSNGQYHASGAGTTSNNSEKGASTGGKPAGQTNKATQHRCTRCIQEKRGCSGLPRCTACESKKNWVACVFPERPMTRETLEQYLNAGGECRVAGPGWPPAGQ